MITVDQLLAMAKRKGISQRNLCKRAGYHQDCLRPDRRNAIKLQVAQDMFAVMGYSLVLKSISSEITIPGDDGG